jgi:ribonuclease HII
VSKKSNTQLFPSLFVEEHSLAIYSSIAGIDEVGRGCLCGPVVAGIVVLTHPLKYLRGVRDSKLVALAKRKKLSEEIKQSVAAYAIGSASPEEIDTLGIVEATNQAMLRAYWSLPFSPEIILMDGESSTKPIFSKTYRFNKGDMKFYSIAAASIIAKVERDRMLDQLHELYPEYDLSNNKGYGTKKHIEALFKFGATPIHRKSFLKFLS